MAQLEISQPYRSALFRRIAVLAVVVCTASCLIGCREAEDGIRVYRVPKPQQQRILAAMIPYQDKIWIFKVAGSDRKVAEFEPEFIAFLQTIKFEGSADADPKWQMPESWEKLPSDHPRNSGSFPRFATLYKPDDEHIERTEIAVSSLPRRGNDPWEFDVKRNVHRWRGQLGLPEVSFAQLDAYFSEIPLENDLTATLVKLFEGETQPDPLAVVAPVDADASDDQLPFSYDKPDAWPRGPKVPFSLLGFRVNDGDQSVVISVTPAGGGLLPNVNRWRGQLGLKPFEQAELEKTAKKLTAGEVVFDYVQLVGAQQTILAAVGTHNGQMWFVKLKGDNELADRERENFETFVQSMRFKS